MQKIEKGWQFSERSNHIPRSFIREILKVTSQPDIISFAGGLPNPSSFPVQEINNVTQKILNEDGQNALQYSISQGYLPLRDFISARYAQKGLKISSDEIIITNGSQQGLDLLGKIFIDEGDEVLLERPSYLGAIQAFSAYQPNFRTVGLQQDGVDMVEFKEIIMKRPIKLFYAIPTFQNPSGIVYSENKRREIGEILNGSNVILVEDNPYEEISFTDEVHIPIKRFAGQNGILLGSFSKILSPGLRLGWVVANKNIISRLLVAKEASDLHSNLLAQRIAYQFFVEYDLDTHINKIRNIYKSLQEQMINAIDKFFPKDIKIAESKGGMFIWVKLPKYISARDVFVKSQLQKVVFVPGGVFYIDRVEENTMRLNFSNSNNEEIERGIKVLAEILTQLIK